MVVAGMVSGIGGGVLERGVKRVYCCGGCYGGRMVEEDGERTPGRLAG